MAPGFARCDQTSHLCPAGELKFIRHQLCTTYHSLLPPPLSGLVPNRHQLCPMHDSVGLSCVSSCLIWQTPAANLGVILLILLMPGACAWAKPFVRVERYDCRGQLGPESSAVALFV